MNTQYTIREYCEETDFATFFKNWNDHNWKTLGYLLSGASPYISEEKARDELQKMGRRCRYPVVIADSQNKPIGCVTVLHYIRISRRHNFHIILWEHPELMENILQETLDLVLNSSIVDMAVCTVAGYEEAFLESCRKLGMEQVGCIPSYEVFEGKAYPEYTFIMKKADWVKLNNKGTESTDNARNPFGGLSAWYVWSEVLWYMKERLSEETVTAWFDEVEVESLTQDKLVVSTSSEFRCEIIRRRCVPFIQDAFKEHYRAEIEVVVRNRNGDNAAQ